MADRSRDRILETHDASNGRVYLGNGYIGLELSPVGGFLLGGERSSSRIRGLYSDIGSDGIDRLITLTGWLDIRYDVEAEITTYRRRLDLDRGAIVTQLAVREDRGTINVEQTVVLSRADPHTAVVRTVLRPSFDGKIDLVTLDLSPIPGLIDSGITVEPIPCAFARTRKYAVEFALAQHVLEDIWTGETAIHQGGAIRRITARVTAGEAVVLTVVTRLATSLESPDPRDQVMRDPGSYQSIVAAHRHAHSRLRETAIEIDGDDEAQRFV